jgi:hypothetical protein
MLIRCTVMRHGVYPFLDVRPGDRTEYQGQFFKGKEGWTLVVPEYTGAGTIVREVSEYRGRGRI